MVSDTGQHFVFDFSSDLRICRPFEGFLSQSMPYLPLIYPKKQLFYEKMLVSGDYICSLVREEKKVNWFTFNAKKMINTLLNNKVNEEWIL